MKYPKYISAYSHIGKVINIRKCIFVSDGDVDFEVKFINIPSISLICSRSYDYKEITEEEYNVALVLES